MSLILALFTAERVEAWVTWGGSLVIFALLFACGLGLPLPEDIPLLVGGYFVGQGKMHLVVLCVLAWCGIIGGDCCLYFLARRYGLNVTRLPLMDASRHIAYMPTFRGEVYSLAAAAAALEIHRRLDVPGAIAQVGTALANAINGVSRSLGIAGELVIAESESHFAVECIDVGADVRPERVVRLGPHQRIGERRRCAELI